MPSISRRMFLMGGVSFLPYLYLEKVSLAVRRYQVEVRGLPPAFEGFTILHLSDLHEKEFGKGGSELVDLIKDERFDIVAFTGDLVVGHNPNLTPALELIASLGKRCGRPIYSVSGNHDWYQGRGKEFEQKLREAGVRVLANGSERLRRGTDSIWIVGVEDPVTGRDRLRPALQGTEGGPRLLLAHAPSLFPQAIENGIDLMLSGHTHGGQIRLPLLGAAYIPGMGFFPPWDYGLYSSGATTLIVSGGLGESGIPVRFNIRPELALVTLRRSPESRSAQPTAA